jgi:hypothetical protein
MPPNGGFDEEAAIGNFSLTGAYGGAYGAYGSVRGALSNERPCRDPKAPRKPLGVAGRSDLRLGCAVRRAAFVAQAGNFGEKQ